MCHEHAACVFPQVLYKSIRRVVRQRHDLCGGPRRAKRFYTVDDRLARANHQHRLHIGFDQIGRDRCEVWFVAVKAFQYGGAEFYGGHSLLRPGHTVCAKAVVRVDDANPRDTSRVQINHGFLGLTLVHPTNIENVLFHWFVQHHGTG